MKIEKKLKIDVTVVFNKFLLNFIRTRDKMGQVWHVPRVSLQRNLLKSVRKTVLQVCRVTGLS